MRSIRPLLGVLVLVAAACGGSGGKGDDDDNIDAPKAIDAAPDASTTLAGLGQKCGQGMPACPMDAPACFTFTAGATTGICSKVCVETSNFMTNAMAQPGAFNPDPNTQNQMCSAIYHGGIGQGVCAVPFNLMPADAMLQKNKPYTISFGCGITCAEGTSACPGGMTCNTQAGLCLP